MKDSNGKLTLYGEAATELDTTYAGIRARVKSLGIEPKPVRYNGNAKGLDPRDMARLRKALGISRRSRRDATPATSR